MKNIFLIFTIQLIIFSCTKIDSTPTPANNSGSTNTLDIGLVAYYPFNGNAKDESGNNHNGTVSGATLTTDKSGQANKAYSFNYDSSSYILVSDAADLRLDDTDYSISMWVNEVTRTYQSALISKRGSGSANGYLLYVQGSSQPSPGKIIYTESSGADPIMYSSSILPLNSWTHLVLTYSVNSNITNIYVNGTLDATSTNIPIPNASTSNSMYIGADQLLNYYFTGSIDEIRIYHRVLSDSEIKSLLGN